MLKKAGIIGMDNFILIFGRFSVELMKLLA